MTQAKKAETTPTPAQVVGGLLLCGVTMMGLWLLVLYTLTRNEAIAAWLGVSGGLTLAHMGQLGDSFAPVTAVFALIATVGAWGSLRSQRDQMMDQQAVVKVEHQRATESKFDELFFRLVADYRSTLLESRYTRTGRATDEEHVIGVTANQKLYSGEDLLALMANARNKRVMETIPANLPYSDYRVWVECMITNPCAPLWRVLDQIVATLDWLEQAAGRDVDVTQHGRMLRAKLSEPELWFWQVGLAYVADSSASALARRLGLYRRDDDRGSSGLSFEEAETDAKTAGEALRKREQPDY